MSIDLAELSPDVELRYRALSTAAVVSLVLGVASVVMIPTALISFPSCLVAAVIPLAGVAVGFLALARIRRDPGAFTGRRLALAGIALAATFLAGGIALADYVYVTEVPEGYARVTFEDMRPDEEEQLAGTTVPSDVMQYDGKQVFVKGYMRPPEYQHGNKSFLLVRDNNVCCFGKTMPAYYDRILVNVGDPHGVSYAQRQFRVGGTLRIDPQAATRGPGQPVYTLDSNYLK